MVPMPFIIGAPRSGTTLLRFMLDAHPEMAIPPETGFVPLAGGLGRQDFFDRLTHFPPGAPNWSDFGLDASDFRAGLDQIDPFTCSQGLRTLYRLYAAKHDKPRYGEKTPGYGEHIATIENLLPEAHFIHIIRDGRDVALSLRPLWFSPGRDMATLARYWRNLVEQGRAGGALAKSYLEVRYEDLILTPEATLAGICAFLKLDFRPEMLFYWKRTPGRLIEHGARVGADGRILVSREQRLDQQRLTLQPPQPSRIFAWREHISAAEHAEFLSQAGDTLASLGYRISHSGMSPSALPRN